MRKQITVIFFIAVLTLAGCSNPSKNISEQGSVITEIDNNAAMKPGENIPISRAMAAKMISLAFSDTEDIYNLDKEIDFIDVKENDWYYPYINSVCYMGYMQGFEKEFLPNEPLNLKQVQILLSKFSDKVLKINKNNEDKPVSCRLWTELFYEAIEEKEKELNYKVMNVSVFATAEIGNMAPWSMSTDVGVIKCDGYAIDSYVDKTISVILKDEELIGILSVEKDQAEFENAYIEKTKDNKINVVFESGTRQFTYENAVESPIGTIKTSDNKILEIDFADSKINEVIKLSDTDRIEFENKGQFETDNNFKIYDIANGNTVEKGMNALVCGEDIGDIYFQGNKACGAVITKNPQVDDVRVLIGTSNFEGYIHEKAIFEGNTFKVLTGETTINTNKIVLPDDDSKLFLENNRIYVSTTKSGGTTISSIERNWQGSSPVYEGVFEIEKRDDGYVIVNEIDIEEYLTAVVPSEMPTSYGLEAAKVQAICARSYAYNQFLSNKYHSYGANIDDSVLSQVYNNNPANETSIKAVEQTKGMLLKYNGEVISANFFSTSAGTFANSGDVWANGNEFPTDYKEYLSAHSETSMDLTKEENMRKFIEEEKAGYDDWNEWSRWSVEMSGEALSSTIEKNLKTAYENSPTLVKTLQSDYTFKSREITSLGKIKNIQVLKRGAGGNIMGLKIEGENSTVLLRTEYIIRTVLRPMGYNAGDIMVVLKNGRAVVNYALMPSAFFVFDMVKDEEGYITAINFIGGGNGHGAGMSQNGVKQMVDDGKSYSEIIEYYYKGTEITEN